MYGSSGEVPRDAAAAPLQAAVGTVFTAQIPRASGYSAAEPAALRALSNIAGRYIASLARAAVALAESRGRAEPNVIDLVLALEDHPAGRFPGASDLTRPVLCPSALVELAGFVAAVREVGELRGGGKGWESFAVAGREPPLRHVPRWLPNFPEGVAAKEEEDTGDVVTVMVNGNGSMEGRGAVPDKREKVSFRLGKKKRRVGPGKCGGGFERFGNN